MKDSNKKCNGHSPLSIAGDSGVLNGGAQAPVEHTTEDGIF